MQVTIHKGKHRAWPIPIGIYWDRKFMARKVILGFDAIYKLADPSDQEDVNKLFGLGYVDGGHIVDSVRWGYRYNLNTKLYEYCSYFHVNREVIFQTVCSLNAVNSPVLRIIIEPKKYILSAFDGYQVNKMIGEVQQPYDHNKKLQYKLGPYFGGNNVSPKDIKIELKKV
jgi:hypothetical protein